LDILVL